MLKHHDQGNIWRKLSWLTASESKSSWWQSEGTAESSHLDWSTTMRGEREEREREKKRRGKEITREIVITYLPWELHVFFENLKACATLFNPSQTFQPTRERVFKYVSLQGPFSFKLPQNFVVWRRSFGDVIIWRSGDQGRFLCLKCGFVR